MKVYTEKNKRFRRNHLFVLQVIILLRESLLNSIYFLFIGNNKLLITHLIGILYMFFIKGSGNIYRILLEEIAN